MSQQGTAKRGLSGVYGVRDGLADLFNDMSAAIQAMVEGGPREASEAALQVAWDRLQHYLPEAIQNSERFQQTELDLTNAWNDYRATLSKANARRTSAARRLREEFERYCSAVLA